MNKKNLIIAIVVLVVITMTGYFLPLGSYTTVNGCPANTTPSKRITLISGDSLDKVKENDKQPTLGEGCAQNTKYVLYLW